MAKKIGPNEVKQINELYYKLHTYAAVAREMGIAAGTVSKYVDKNWRPVDTTKMKHFHLEQIPQLELSIFHLYNNFGELCVLTPEEVGEIEELWEELDG